MTSSQNLGSGDKSKRQSNTVYRRISIKNLNERTCFDKFKSDRKAFNRHSTSLSIESQGESYQSRKVNIPKKTDWIKYRLQALAIFIGTFNFENGLIETLRRYSSHEFDSKWTAQRN